MLYKNFGPLSAEHGKIRIYAPVAYPLVRQMQIVPIVHIEAVPLAAWFPICWRIDETGAVLAVLRTLREDGTHQPIGSPEAPSSLPLALRAYPFVAPIPGTDAASVTDTPLIEDATADAPTDIGAPILQSDGKAGRGTQMRLRAVRAFQDALAMTTAMTAELSRNDLFEAWPLDFEIGDEMLSVGNMFIVRQTAFGTAPIVQFMKKFGPAGATLLGAHRISLFRAGTLVTAARKGAVTAPARNQAP